jgi:hypothetical protein
MPANLVSAPAPGRELTLLAMSPWSAPLGPDSLRLVI